MKKDLNEIHYKELLERLSVNFEGLKNVLRLDPDVPDYDEKLVKISEKILEFNLEKRTDDTAKIFGTLEYDRDFYKNTVNSVINGMKTSAEINRNKYENLCIEEEFALVSEFIGYTDFKRMNREYRLSDAVALYLQMIFKTLGTCTEKIPESDMDFSEGNGFPFPLSVYGDKNFMINVSGIVSEMINEGKKENFARLLNLLPKEEITLCLEEFMTKQQELLQICYSIRNIYRGEEVRLCRKIYNLFIELSRETKHNSALKRNNILCPENKHNSFMLTDIESEKDRLNNRLRIEEGLQEKITSFLSNENEIRKILLFLTHGVGCMEDISKKYKQEICDFYEKFKEANPFRIITGFCISLAENLENVWYSGLTIGTVSMAVSMLPWGRKTVISENKSYINNFAQMLFETNEIAVVPLCYYRMNRGEKEWIKEIADDNQRSFLLELISDRLTEEYKKSGILEEQIKKLQNETEILLGEKEKLKKINQSLEGKIRLLEHSRKIQQEKNDEQKIMAEPVMTEEIHGEMQESIQEKEKEFVFPYIPKKKIVVFGGHDSWLREIKKKIKNVKYVKPEVKSDINLIRTADKVWIQTNAIPHMQYNTVLDVTRTYNIPVKYFSFASAGKCAIQLAEDDSEE